MPRYTKKNVEKTLAVESRGLAVEQDGPSLAALNKALIKGPRNAKRRAALKELSKNIVLDID